VLVLRETTERPEAVECGAAQLVGSDPNAIFEAADSLLRDDAAYRAMAKVRYPFGDGEASTRIAMLIQAFLNR
jgi:UDP-N-acetylglucosamine 2-epimerase (non-hydrolysing)